MKTNELLEEKDPFNLIGLNDIPVIIRLKQEPEKVAAYNGYARKFGIRKGMLINLICYFCWKPLIITVDGIQDCR